MKIQTILSMYNSERGVSAIWIAILVVVFFGFGALALDLSHIVVAQNELKNAADAGALAGARFLYNDYGTAVNPGANLIGYDAARANRSEKISVEVNWTSGNTGDVQRGHWSFGLGDEPRGFQANPSLEPVDLWGVSDIELDENLNFINAVQVTSRREATPIVAYLARIFRRGDFTRTTTSVAYIGFAGTLSPGDADVPIAVCQQSLTGKPEEELCGGGGYDCNIGYMLSDGQEKNTAAWTNFTQDPCETASTTSLRPLLTCAESNPGEISLGDKMGATNGVNKAVLEHPENNNLVDCWKNGTYWVDDLDGDNKIDDDELASIDRDEDGWPDMPWNLTLPVVNCPDLKIGNCMETCGAVNVNVVWILVQEDPTHADAPYKMDDWSNDSEDGVVRWDSFVDHFELKKVDEFGNMVDATVANDGHKQKSIYFLPDCDPHPLKGSSGGHNYGVLARIPVLVD